MKKTKPDGTDGYFLGPFYLEISSQKNTLSVAKMTVQERQQVYGLKEKEV